MTEGASDAIADLGAKVQLVVDLHTRTQENQAAIISRLEQVATTQDQAATFDAGVERLVSTFQPFWEAQKAEVDAAHAADLARRQEQAAHEAHEKAARMARDRARAEQRARIYRLGQSLAVPILMSAIGTPLALLTSISGTLPQRVVVVLSVLIFTAGCGFSLYWGVLSKPPVIEDVEAEERIIDHPPTLVTAAPGQVITTSTTTTPAITTTTVTTPGVINGKEETAPEEAR